MIYNATITLIETRSGHDAEGAPTYTARVGGPWKCCMQRPVKKYIGVPAERSRPPTRELYTDALFDIAAGDRVTVDGEAFRVIEAGVQPGELRTLRLVMGSPL